MFKDCASNAYLVLWVMPLLCAAWDVNHPYWFRACQILLGLVLATYARIGPNIILYVHYQHAHLASRLPACQPAATTLAANIAAFSFAASLSGFTLQFHQTLPFPLRPALPAGLPACRCHCGVIFLLQPFVLLLYVRYGYLSPWLLANFSRACLACLPAHVPSTSAAPRSGCCNLACCLFIFASASCSETRALRKLPKCIPRRSNRKPRILKLGKQLIKQKKKMF